MKMLRYTAQHNLHLSGWAKCVGLTTGAAVMTYPGEQSVTPVWLADVSHLPRLGLKGRGAAEWLAERGLGTPARHNSWTAIADSPWSVLVRLGSNEYLLEQEGSARALQDVAQALCSGVPGIYPVLREDSEFVVGGSAVDSLLAEVCSINFGADDPSDQTAYLTTMTGASVLIIAQPEGRQRRYRIWCDPSFGAYLWITLKQLIADHSGAILGLEQLPHAPQLPPVSERVTLGEDVA